MKEINNVSLKRSMFLNGVNKKGKEQQLKEFCSKIGMECTKGKVYGYNYHYSDDFNVDKAVDLVNFLKDAHMEINKFGVEGNETLQTKAGEFFQSFFDNKKSPEECRKLGEQFLSLLTHRNKDDNSPTSKYTRSADAIRDGLTKFIEDKNKIKVADITTRKQISNVHKNKYLGKAEKKMDNAAESLVLPVSQKIDELTAQFVKSLGDDNILTDLEKGSYTNNSDALAELEGKMLSIKNDREKEFGKLTEKHMQINGVSNNYNKEKFDKFINLINKNNEITVPQNDSDDSGIKLLHIRAEVYDNIGNMNLKSNSGKTVQKEKVKMISSLNREKAEIKNKLNEATNIKKVGIGQLNNELRRIDDALNQKETAIRKYESVNINNQNDIKEKNEIETEIKRLKINKTIVEHTINFHEMQAKALAHNLDLAMTALQSLEGFINESLNKK